MIKNNIILSVIIVSLLFGLMLGEDSLGGGRNDYLYHEKYFFKFSNNFFDTFNNFGSEFLVRNSPIFYIIFSFFIKIGFSIEHLKIINLLVILPLIFFFNKCIDIKYPQTNNKIKICLLSILFLSPTIRTLLIWPYPFIWGLAFFIGSIYFYLKFEKVKKDSEKFNSSIYNTIFLAAAAYLTPNFAVFSLFFFYKFCLSFGLSKKILNLIFLNIILALPAILFLISQDFYLLKSESDTVEIDSFMKFNLSNKIIIISTFIFFFYLPFINKISNIRASLLKSKKSYFELLVIIIFIFLNIYFYNFIDNAGGGIFYHISNLFFESSIIVFLIFIISLFYFHVIGLYNFQNILIFTTLIIYNMQFTIYYKYFDPLLLFVILFLLKFKNKDFINLEKKYYRLVIFYIIFLSLNLSKMYLNY